MSCQLLFRSWIVWFDLYSPTQIDFLSRVRTNHFDSSYLEWKGFIENCSWIELHPTCSNFINLYWTFLIIKHVTRIKFKNLLYFQFSFFTFLLFLGNQTYLISIFSIFIFTFLQFLSNQINLHFYFLNFLFYFLEISW